MTMKKTSAILIILMASVTHASIASAGSPTQPCTTRPEAEWLPMDKILSIIRDHGYEVLKSKVKNACVEVYARDAAGNRAELFVDPVTGNPVQADVKDTAAQGNRS